jgi:molecular chaperone DnaK
MSDAPCIGIDLGTTYSAVASYGEAGVQMIPNGQRQLLTPSVVELRADGETVVGAAAQRGAIIEPERVFSLFKRQMGTDASYLLDGARITPVDLSAAVLAQLRKDASDAIGADVEEATITVPAYFGDDPRLATRAAAERAGLEVRDLVHEPTAAAIAFGFGQSSEPATLLIYDLGGGTFDVTVVRWSAAEMVVLATCGDHRLGGANWDAELSAMVAETFESRHGLDPRDDAYAAAELQERAESAKRALSRLEQTSIAVVYEAARDRIAITRKDFEDRTRPLLARTEWLVSQALEDARLRPQDLDAVLLVGGSTRMPMCAEALRNATGREPTKGIDPDQAVARGAALLAATRRSRRGSSIGAGTRGVMARLPDVQDVTSHALGFVVIAADESRYVNEVMIPRNAQIPAERRKTRRLDTPRGRPGQLQIYLLQGDAERPLDTAPLGSWTFRDVPAGRRGHAEIEIAFRYDLDGVVEIAAAVDGADLPPPSIDREDRDISWTDGDPRAQPQVEPLSVILAIDYSASMEGAPVQEAERACIEFARELSEHPACRLGVVGFAAKASILVDLQPIEGGLDRAKLSLRTAFGTNMAAGLTQAGDLLEGCPGRRAIVLLTDGFPDDAKSTEAVAARLAGNGVELHPRGVLGADEKFLRRLASNDGDLMTDLDGLAGTFRGIARQLADASSLRRL